MRELHSSFMWSERINNIKSQSGRRIKKTVKPLKITDRLAGAEGVWWYCELLELYSEAKDLGIVWDIIVHGSYGDFSTTNFSDLELTVIVSPAVMNDRELKLRFSNWVKGRLNKFIVKVDPIQHHGAFYIWPQLQKFYSELILPCSSYDSCWSITGSQYDFFVVDDVDSVKLASHYRLKLTLQKLITPERYFFRFGYCDYSIKQYLSNLMLVPAFYYQSKGESLNKKSAIQRFYNEKVGFFSRILQDASDLRESWPASSKVLRRVRPIFVSDNIPQNSLDIIALSLFRNRLIGGRFRREFMPNAIKWADEFLELIGENCQ